MELYFAENLRFLRRKMGLTQSELGAKMDKGHTTIGNWEKRNSRPSIEEMAELARFFQLSIDELMNYDLANNYGVRSSRKAPSLVSESVDKNGVLSETTLLQHLKIQQKYIEILQEENRLLKQIAYGNNADA